MQCTQYVEAQFIKRDRDDIKQIATRTILDTYGLQCKPSDNNAGFQSFLYIEKYFVKA